MTVDKPEIRRAAVAGMKLALRPVPLKTKVLLELPICVELSSVREVGEISWIIHDICLHGYRIGAAAALPFRSRLPLVVHGDAVDSMPPIPLAAIQPV